MAKLNDGPLRVVFVTRLHALGALFLAAALVGALAGLRDAKGARPATVDGGGFVISMDQPVRQVPAAKGRVAFTINVDWGNEVLPDMLDVFERHGIQVTFFLTGRWAQAFPEMAAMLAAAGHEIANHGMTHAHPTHLSQAQLDEHIGGNVETLRQATGAIPVPLYAPPYGEQNDAVVRSAARLGQWTTLWTLDTIDWQEPSPQTIVNRIVPRASDGAIVLMHPKPQTLAALEPMIEGLKAKGFEVAPLWRMMLEAGAVVNSGVPE